MSDLELLRRIVYLERTRSAWTPTEELSELLREEERRMGSGQARKAWRELRAQVEEE